MNGTGPSAWNSAPGGFDREDRRSIGRLLPPAPIAARVRGLHFARILDISRRGALAESVTAVRPLERSEILIHFQHGPFLTQALVRRCRAWREGIDGHGDRILFYQSGLEFDSLSRSEAEDLEKILHALPTEAPAAPLARVERRRTPREPGRPHSGRVYRTPEGRDGAKNG